MNSTEETMFDFFGLPLELRNEIYEQFSISTMSCENHQIVTHQCKFNPRALLVSKQFATEYKRHLSFAADKGIIVVETSALWTCGKLRTTFRKSAHSLNVRLTYTQARVELPQALLVLLKTAKIYALGLTRIKTINLTVKITGKEIWGFQTCLLEDLDKDERFHMLEIIDGNDGSFLLGWRRGKGVVKG